MAAPTRIYIVRNATADIDAETGKSLRTAWSGLHPSHALRHVAADPFEVKVASQDDLVAAFESGIKVRDHRLRATWAADLTSFRAPRVGLLP